MPMARHQWRFLPSALALVARLSRACPAGSRASLHIADRHPFGSQLLQGMAGDLHRRADGEQQIGRATGRERGGQAVSRSVVAVSIKKKKSHTEARSLR